MALHSPPSTAHQRVLGEDVGERHTSKVAKGRGSLKPTPATPQQPTIFNVLREQQVRDDDVWRVDE